MKYGGLIEINDLTYSPIDSYLQVDLPALMSPVNAPSL